MLLGKRDEKKAHSRDGRDYHQPENYITTHTEIYDPTNTMSVYANPSTSKELVERQPSQEPGYGLVATPDKQNPVHS